MSAQSLDRLHAAVQRPTYAWQASGAGIVHLGVGAFMRAHTAVYCDDAMSADGGDWRIHGVSLRHADMRDRLAPQDCLFTLCVRDHDAETRQLVAALASMHVAPEDPAAVIALLADPAVHVVTLTVTEKGYCLDPASGALDAGHPLIRHDLEHPGTPQSTIGFLAAGLAARYRNGRGPVTIVTCDNLPGNGRLLRAAVLAFASQADRPLRDWIADRVTFPETMIDRIVPATVAADLAASETALGVHDAAPVRTEPFRQWIIEDRFAGPRPAWEAGGALFVADVEPYESAKLRLLNGTHSTIAYLGYLAGYRYVHEVMQVPEFVKFLRHLMTREISPVTPEPAGMEHAAYIDELLRRFANPSLEHRTWQIAMDGSQKIPQRWLRTVQRQLDRGGPIAGLSLAIAAWMRYVLGTDDAGNAIDVSDPLAPRFTAIARRCGSNAEETVAAFLQESDIFGTSLAGDARFRAAVSEHLAELATRGSAECVRRFDYPEQYA